MPPCPRRTLLKRPSAELYHRWGVDCFQRLSTYVGGLVLQKYLTGENSRRWFDRINDLGLEVQDLEWWHPTKRRDALCSKVALLWREVAIMARSLSVEP